jgi:hypothetical protein
MTKNMNMSRPGIKVVIVKSAPKFWSSENAPKDEQHTAT